MITYVETKYPIFVITRKIYKKKFWLGTPHGKVGVRNKNPQNYQFFCYTLCTFRKNNMRAKLRMIFKAVFIVIGIFRSVLCSRLFFLSSLKNNQWLSDKWTIHMFFICLSSLSLFYVILLPFCAKKPLSLTQSLEIYMNHSCSGSFLSLILINKLW